tara:strand:+ start:75 stop:497 length:423 start_codon:yes stop_codon:yes gene_type:complete
MDPDAQELKIRFPDGSLAMPLGNMTSLFGEGAQLLLQDGVPVTGTRTAHTRVRVIGGGSTPVGQGNINYTQFPTSNRANAAAGKKCMIRWTGSDGWWTARFTGTAANLGEFLQGNAANPVEFVTSRGTEYGPFRGVIDGN